jgi:hypothetical protein
VPGEARRKPRLGRVSAVSADALRFWFRREAVRRATPSEHRGAAAAPRVGESTHGPRALQHRAVWTRVHDRRPGAANLRCIRGEARWGAAVSSRRSGSRSCGVSARRWGVDFWCRWCAPAAVSMCVSVAVGARASGCSTPVVWLEGTRTVPSGAASSAGVRRRIVRGDHAGVSGDSCTVVVADGEGGRYFRPGGRSACRGWTGGWAPDRRSAGDGGGDGCRKRAAGHVVSVPDLWASLVRQRGVAGRAGGGAVMAGARRGETKRGRRGDPAGGRAEKGVPLGARRVSRPPTRGERR